MGQPGLGLFESKLRVEVTLCCREHEGCGLRVNGSLVLSGTSANNVDFILKQQCESRRSQGLLEHRGF